MPQIVPEYTRYVISQELGIRAISILGCMRKAGTTFEPGSEGYDHIQEFVRVLNILEVDTKMWWDNYVAPGIKMEWKKV